MIFEDKTKSNSITKEQVWEAFKLVKSKGGSAGIDGISIEEISENPKKHLYPVWNRLASGSYFPPAVKRVSIPKGDGKERHLGIPTVKDRVAQMVIAKELEEILEPIFSKNSFGYRPNKNAHQAIAQARGNCWKYPWVIDMDIKGFFDNIDHGLMIKALRYYTDKKYIITYVKRWLKAPIQLKDGSQLQNLDKGTPQGGVISPLLANLFLHIVFDKWIEKEFTDCPFERYADDIIVHVKHEKYAKFVLKSIRERMAQCKLELHPEKTKLVYCNQNGRRKRTKAKDRQFDFLGYTFRSRKVENKEGKVFFGFSPAISRKSMKRITKECQKLGFHRWTHLDVHQLAAALAPKIRGWLYYYGRFHKTAMEGLFEIINRRISKWAFNKYKRFKRRKFVTYAQRWLRQIAKDFPYIFPHWQQGFTP
ncbi:MAG: group II intron reverse transcriptase/maturase [Saprospiraceae bacterium]